MRRMIAAAIFAVLGVTLLSAPPAEAYVTYTSEEICEGLNSDSTITVCAQVKWKRQEDGNGVRVEGWTLSTFNGCSKLESDPPYDQVTMDIYKPSDGTLFWYHNWGAEPCNSWNDMERNGPETGDIKVNIHGKARIDHGTDQWWAIDLRLSANGDINLIRKDHGDW